MPPKRKQNTKDVDNKANSNLKRTNGKAEKEDEGKEVQSENKPKKKTGPKNTKQAEEMEENVATKQPVARTRAALSKKEAPDSEKNNNGEEEQPPKQKRGKQVQKEEPLNEDDEENVKTAAEPTRKRGAKSVKEHDQSDEEVEEATKEVPKPAQKRGGRAKKEKKEVAEEAPRRLQQPRGKSKKEEEVVEEVPKPTRKRKVEPKKEKEQLDDEDEEPAEKATKPNRQRAKSEKPNGDVKAVKPTKTKANPQNKMVTDWDHIDFSCKKQNPEGNDHNLKITSWNVDGIRAWLQKDGLEIFRHDNPDILCLQETKCSNEKLPEEVKKIEGYHAYWCPSDKQGYAGVAIFTKTEPVSVTYGIGHEDHDTEGRSLTLEFENFYLINVYVPNAGRGLVTLPKRLQWNKDFKTYVKDLDNKKPVILCGDMNVSHNEIDLTNPTSNKKNAGFTQEERDGMTEFLSDGYIDTFRNLYPKVKDVYTFWSYMSNARAKNVGWRLDYFIISERIKKKICDNVVRSEVFGSDHCPISLFLHI